MNEIFDIKNVTIRSVTTAEIDTVYDIEALSFADPWSKKSFNNMVSDEYEFLVILHNDVIVGYAIIDYQVPGEATLLNIAITPNFRGYHLSHLLLSELLIRAKAKSITRVLLEVRESNTAARKVYTNLGFIQVGFRRNYYHNPKEGAVLMDFPL